jgi:hypothetical protein
MTVTLGGDPGLRVPGNPLDARQQLLDQVEYTVRLREVHLEVARQVGVALEVPSAQERERYGWRDGLDFLFRPASEDADLVHVTRMIFNWRLQVLRPNYGGGLDIVAHWCFPSAQHLESFVAVVRALAVWRGDVHGEPAGYVKKLDARPETRTGRRAR